MRRREFIAALGSTAVWPLSARAQQPKKVPRIGVLWQSESAETHPYYKSLRDGFKAVGYVEGSVTFEDRFFGMNLEKADLLAKELVDLKCDVLVGITVPAALALRRATSTIPIVFVFNARPVASGLVSSLNHPGGNVTGVSHVTADLASKRVELLKDTIPGLSSVALIWNPSLPIQFINRPELEDSRTAANQLGLSFEWFECGSPAVLEEVISKASRFGAAIIGNSSWYILERKRIAELGIAGKLAVIAAEDLFAEAGCLMSYGANLSTVARAAAPMVKKLLEGEKPENIPVEEPTVFDLVFNLKTAQSIGLQIPPIMMARATRVID